MIWLALRLLYELHFHGGLTREDGVAYKQELKKDYERNLAQEAEWLRAGTAMKLLRQSENPEVKKIVEENIHKPWLGLFGTYKVNVLKLNVALDAAQNK